MPLIQLKQMLRITHTHTSHTLLFIVHKHTKTYTHTHTYTRTRSRIYAYKFIAYRTTAQGKKGHSNQQLHCSLKSLRFYFWQLKLIGHQNVGPSTRYIPIGRADEAFVCMEYM